MSLGKLFNLSVFYQHRLMSKFLLQTFMYLQNLVKFTDVCIKLIFLNEALCLAIEEPFFPSTIKLSITIYSSYSFSQKVRNKSSIEIYFVSLMDLKIGTSYFFQKRFILLESKCVRERERTLTVCWFTHHMAIVGVLS